MPENHRAKQVLDLCERALELDSAERDQFLVDECGDDTRLRRSVDSMLIAIDQADTSLGTLDVDVADLTGRRIDNYEIQERLGKGGMGSVYLAHRHETGFDQRVAIKFVHGHLMNRELIERFNAERQILAALNHPYIAALIDGGTTPEGIPYIVMEYVDGEPIDAYCDAHQLDLKARIRLVQKVAMAVQAAHQNLVVHRDLKPSNVLITPDGIPKLLDFGIAKLIQVDDAENRGNTTIFGRQAMTPDYASPEQILENKVTTASDVYTLGVLTYQLLVGERPYHIQTSSHREMMQSVEGLTIPRPSTRLDTVATEKLRGDIAARRSTTPGQLQRSLQGDLDNILLMALRQEPDRRYHSIAQFSDDLNSYLRALPVIARQDGTRYRMQKFVQRNRLAVGAAVLVVLSLAAGLLGYASQAREAQRQRDIAVAEANHAAITVDFLKQVLFVGDPYSTSENERTIDDILAYAVEHVDEEYAGNPDSRATILAALADISTARSDYELAEKLSAEAIALHEEELGTTSNSAANAYRVHAVALRYLDDYEGANQGFLTAIDLYANNQEPDWAMLASAYDDMGMIQGDLLKHEEAVEYFLLALSTYHDHNVDNPSQLVATLSNFGVQYLDTGDYDLAARYIGEAIDVARTTADTSDAQLAMLLQNQAGVMSSLGRMDESIGNYEQALELMIAALGPTHRDTIVLLTSFAATHQQMNNLGEAETVIRRALAAQAQTTSPNRFIESYVQYYAGFILCLKGASDEGMPYAEASLATRQELLPPEHPLLYSGHSIIGVCHTARGEFEIAETMLLDALAKSRAARGEDHEGTLGIQRRVHGLYAAWSKPEEAERYAISTD